ncbi:acyl-CoA dehydrogenase family protein [Nisaea acidiphila]|uniref:Acyl-CoA dehydrogenase family protein n=1 Tax=Nisaea acidiphila TaxID=1862145 RepID=A0A9J7ARR0_9PROT|nr:acyl-CoA dehydrogenase family protein [Nisaea acidiphila]UUX50048.1 acyl-CoA dehydrogenase family protein [Nisaea acidiphila]
MTEIDTQRILTDAALDWTIWPFFDDSHRALQTRIKTELAADLADIVEDEHKGTSGADEISVRFVRRLGQRGWLRFAVPAAYGGVHDELESRSLVMMRCALGELSGLADFAFAMQGLGSASVSLFGSEELKSALLPDVATGDRIAAFALSEPNAGSDVAALETVATPDGDGFVLNGLKTFISNAGIADHYVTFAKIEGIEGRRNMGAFVIEADTPGLTVAEKIDVIAPHPLGALRFEDCRVPAARMLGAPGDGFKIAMATLDIFRPTVGAAALGFARQAFAHGMHRALTRPMMGQMLGEHQITQTKLAEMALALESSALLIARAAWAKDRGEHRTTREAAMAKLQATEAAQHVIDAAVQLWGGLGVVSGMPVARLYQEIRALRIYEGASEVQKLIIGRHLLSCMQEKN